MIFILHIVNVVYHVDLFVDVEPSLHFLTKSHLIMVLKSESVSCSVLSDSLWLQGLGPARLLCPWNSQSKNTGVGSHSLFQGIFLIQGLNLGLLHCTQILYHLSHQGSYNPFNLLLNLICSYSVENFCICFYLRWQSVFFFFQESIWFWYQGNAGLVKWVWKHPILFSILEEFEKGRY